MTARRIALAGMLLLFAGCGGDGNGGHQATATLTPIGMPTPTNTLLPSAMPTSTPTATATIGATPLGTRLFVIAAPTGGVGASPGMTRTGFFGTPLNGNTVAIGITGQDPILVAGTPDENGMAPLRLQSDVFYAIADPVDVVCVHIIAEGSSGEIDCDGGTAYGVRLEQESGDVGPSGEPETGLGDDSGEGAASLRALQESVRLPIGTTLEQCIAATYDPPLVTVFTTALATASKGAKSLAVAGENFDCDAFTDSDSGGMLAGPLVGFVISPPLGDVAYVMRLAASPRVSP